MLSGCAKLLVDNALQIVNVFALGATNAYANCFSNITKAQNRSAASIINGITAPYDTNAFLGATGFNDLATIPANWK
jgi:hypothetical protein